MTLIPGDIVYFSKIDEIDIFHTFGKVDGYVSCVFENNTFIASVIGQNLFRGHAIILGNIDAKE